MNLHIFCHFDKVGDGLVLTYYLTTPRQGLPGGSALGESSVFFLCFFFIFFLVFFFFFFLAGKTAFRNTEKQKHVCLVVNYILYVDLLNT